MMASTQALVAPMLTSVLLKMFYQHWKCFVTSMLLVQTLMDRTHVVVILATLTMVSQTELDVQIMTNVQTIHTIAISMLLVLTTMDPSVALVISAERRWNYMQ